MHTKIILYYGRLSKAVEAVLKTYGFDVEISTERDKTIIIPLKDGERMVLGKSLADQIYSIIDVCDVKLFKP